MGFWTKIRNWVRGKGYIEDEELKRREEERTKTKEKKIEKELETIRPEPRREEKKIITTEEKKEISKLPEEAKLPEAKEIKLEEKEATDTESILRLKPEIQGKLKAPRPKITQQELNQKLNENIRRIGDAEPVLSYASGDYLDSANDMKQAVLNALKGSDMTQETRNNLADLVVQNAQMFKPRFTVYTDITAINEKTGDITQGTVSSIGSLLHEVKEYYNENMIITGGTIAGDVMATIFLEERTQGISMNTPQYTGILHSDQYKIESMIYRVKFS